MALHPKHTAPAWRPTSLFLLLLLLLCACSCRTRGASGRTDELPIAAGTAVSPGGPAGADSQSMSPEDLAEAVSPDLANKGAQDGKLLTQFLTVVAPDRALCACARQVPAMDRPYRTMIDGVLVAIAPVEIHPSEFALISDTVARHVFAKRLVDHIQWSPDSKFLVFTTSSSGGHSPWHFQSFFFCLEDKSFRNLEEALGGTVTSGDFEFEPPHTVVMTVGLAPERQVRASLSDLVGKSKPITDKPAE